MKYKIKTIDINAKEWLDKPNANSYFSARVTLNYGMEDSEQIVLPMQYGYSDSYIDESCKELDRLGFINNPANKNGGRVALWRYCKENGIILRKNIQHGCKKKDVENFGSIPSTTDRIDNFKA
jgi:hypothetical protein